MNKIIFIGKFFPKRLLTTIKEDSFGRVGFSNHNFEKSIMGGLSSNISGDVYCISCPMVYSYPYNNKKLFTCSEQYKDKNLIIQSVSFCNLALLKAIWKVFATASILLFTIRKIEGDVDIIINTPDVFLQLSVRIAMLFTRKRIRTTLIIPDIPSFVNSMTKYNPIKTFILKQLDNLAIKQAREHDFLVLLTEQMMDFIKKPIPHIVMEGLIDEKTYHMTQSFDMEQQQIRSVLYTGTLAHQFGLMNLVEAFERADIPNVELWICGSGDTTDMLKKKSTSNKNIKFYGLVSSEQAFELQHRATILVNPRTSDGEFTKYSFPSKTLEYLLSGKPVIANILPGFPNEYRSYIISPKNESIEALSECLSYVLSKSNEELFNIGKKGRDFVIKNKNSKVQIAKVLNMMNNE